MDEIHEKASKALFEFDQPKYKDFGTSYKGIMDDEYRRVATIAIEAIRERAISVDVFTQVANVLRDYKFDRNKITLDERCSLIIDAVLGPKNE